MGKQNGHSVKEGRFENAGCAVREGDTRDSEVINNDFAPLYH